MSLLILCISINVVSWITFETASSQIDLSFDHTVSDYSSSVLQLEKTLWMALCLPCCYVAETWGYPKAIKLAALTQFVGMLLCVFVTYDVNFFTFGQILVTLALPLLITSISKLISDWFDAGLRVRMQAVVIAVIVSASLITHYSLKTALSTT